MNPFPPALGPWMVAIVPAFVAASVGLRHALAEAAALRRQNRALHDRVTALDGDVARLTRVSRAAERDKDEFLATLSHELRTPLNAILGWTHLLRHHITGPAEREHALDVVERNARRQVAIVADLLDMSRIVTGKLAIRRELLDFGALVRTVADDIRGGAEAKGLALRVDAVDVAVRGDRMRLRQIVTNLIANAVKFTPPGGAITVRVYPETTHAVLEVTDTGIGIPHHSLPLVFDRFRQVESGVTRPYGGLGLGLAIVRTLVELHGGTVEAWSEGHERGATFTVRLPRAEAGA